jgi:hypothetical protein
MKLIISQTEAFKIVKEHFKKKYPEMDVEIESISTPVKPFVKDWEIGPFINGTICNLCGKPITTDHKCSINKRYTFNNGTPTAINDTGISQIDLLRK